MDRIVEIVTKINDAGEECTICWSTLTQEIGVIVPGCGHVFCKYALDILF